MAQRYYKCIFIGRVPKFRLLCLVTIFATVICITACERERKRIRSEREEVELGQNVTNRPAPLDPIFRNFDKNWRRFITTTPKLLLPVVSQQTRQPVWEPIVTSECIYSVNVAGVVPQVTLTWNQSPPSTVESRAAQPPAEAANLRFDLALHHEGLDRNYFTSALASDHGQRFAIPENSALSNDQEAVLLTGPGLLPMLVNYQTETVNASSGQPILRSRLVLRDLAPGLSYTIRLSQLGNNQWTGEQRFVFSTPVCPAYF